MTTISISQLKTNPSSAIAKAADYPVAVENRNTVTAYLIGKNLYEKIVSFIEDYLDARAVRQADVTKGKDFETIAKQLGI